MQEHQGRLKTAFVERSTGLSLPSVEDLSEIESSSRLRAQHGALYLSAPLVHRAAADDPHTTPVGFVKNGSANRDRPDRGTPRDAM